MKKQSINTPASDASKKENSSQIWKVRKHARSKEYLNDPRIFKPHTNIDGEPVSKGLIGFRSSAEENIIKYINARFQCENPVLEPVIVTKAEEQQGCIEEENF